MPFYGKTFRMNIFGLKMLKEMFSSCDATEVYVRFSYINFFVHFSLLSMFFVVWNPNPLSELLALAISFRG